MSIVALSQAEAAPAATTTAPRPVRIALLGLGNVGGAVLQRLRHWQHGGGPRHVQLVYAANSREAFQPSSSPWSPRDARPVPAALAEHAFIAAGPLPGDPLAGVEAALGGQGCRIVIDATASQAVTDRHAHWLARGIHVVTACKLGQGTALPQWHGIRDACAAGNTHYGDSATVGAGLPLIRSIRELQAGGDAIHAIAGVLSGSLAWLFNHYDGMRPFSGFVREARDAGYTEPDPRDDLSGEDVRRKIVILARAAGIALDHAAVQVRSLVPEALAAVSAADVDAALPLLDEPLRRAFAEARRDGEKRLRFVARLRDGAATVGLEALPVDDPLAGGAGTDNRVAIWSDRYDAQPLVIQGPGAGAAVTAAGLLDDVLRIARSQAAS